MNVSGAAGICSFGRALTTPEKKEYKKIQAQAKRELGHGQTIATVFDFSVPTSQKDTGIGTTWSKDAKKLAGFLQSMCGVNAIQVGPQGEISNLVRSPYSGTAFSLGSHSIDLTKLQDKTYGSLLSESDLDSDYMTRTKNHDKVDYDNVFAPDGQKAMLKKAYTNFQQLAETSALKKEFKTFKQKNEYWLEKDALFEACAAANNSADMKTWPDRDQNIFDTKEGDKQRIAELKLVSDEDGNNIVDFEEFVQFIADKQQKESKEEFNKQGIDIYGDCQIGFSQKDFWAHKSAFYPNYEFGCDIGDGKYSCWSPALNLDDIEGEAGELLYNKFDTFFKRYDGVRIDAAWQLINPLICEPWTKNGKDVFDNNGNKLGRKLDHQPKIKNKGQQIIKDIVCKAAKANNVPNNKIFLELLGGNSYDSLDSVKDTGAELIHITRYGSDNWGRVKFYESKGDNKYQNMKPGDYIIGPGTHDDYSLLEQVENAKERAAYLAYDLNLDKNELIASPSKLSNAIFSELFTTKNQFATLPDILGSSKRINTPSTISGNWEYRASQDYEKDYYTNLIQGKGLNTPEALSTAIKAKQYGRVSSLTKKLDKFAQILKQDGPVTTKEADKLILNA
ncbi:MAG: 4-alpha-glucanotransferase [Candidatus Gastranaerophilales bacterium]|nr:4-alpha-glucanotransferase [Candidatus Gastranaerophilales bacterium]